MSDSFQLDLVENRIKYLETQNKRLDQLVQRQKNDILKFQTHKKQQALHREQLLFNQILQQRLLEQRRSRNLVMKLQRQEKLSEKAEELLRLKKQMREQVQGVIKKEDSLKEREELRKKSSKRQHNQKITEFWENKLRAARQDKQKIKSLENLRLQKIQTSMRSLEKKQLELLRRRESSALTVQQLKVKLNSLKKIKI